ncbi:MAG: hypothetical protein IK005_12845 [Paludibacteraceae bacterium]|nr:hypothetical protein [Paludibacteraceae bacterium]
MAVLRNFFCQVVVGWGVASFSEGLFVSTVWFVLLGALVRERRRNKKEDVP